MTRSEETYDSLLESIHEEIDSQPAWRRRVSEWSTARRLTLLVLVGVVVWLVNQFPLVRSDISAYPVVRMIVTLGGFATLAFAMLVLGVERADRRARPGLSAVLAGVAFGVLAAAALFPEAHAAVHAFPEAFSGKGDDFAPRAFGCLMYGSLASLPVLFLFLLVQRQRIALRTFVAGAVASGLVGNIALLLHCPIVDPMHLLVGHALLPLVLFAALAPFIFFRRRM